MVSIPKRRGELSLQSGSLSVLTTIVFPPLPINYFYPGYTSPLLRFERTVIDGLTESPIVLESPYAQTYQSGTCCHNFPSWFVFDPWLDPEVPKDQLDELARADVRLIVVHAYQTDQIWTLADPDQCVPFMPPPRRPGERHQTP
ncbi:MAG: hypothetical protein GY842_17390 [bacterium]|nr:hypothetical protein [bacterium]